jgi:ATP/maltotriose-dependent transcriptional regulator MalT
MSDQHRRHRPRPGSAAPAARELGRACYARRAWAEAHRALSQADDAIPLDAEDLELLAMSAYLIGRDDDYLRMLERAHQAHRDAGRCLPAVRCAFWLGLRLLFRGETGRATGWLGRAHRLLAGEKRECAEHGYLLLPVVEQRLAAGDSAAAYAAADAAAAIGERCGEADLVAIARHLQGRIRLRQREVEAGLALLDEAMVAVAGGELSPLVTGLVYCSVIEACQQVYALGRAREWTAALSRWCEAQPEMMAFTGLCRVHRAEILQLQGAWPDAIAEARRAGERAQDVNPRAAAAALYRQAELHRLRGDLAAAEQAYRGASERGAEPQPGLALLRLAQGRTAAGASAIRRALDMTADRLARTRLLPAYIEIMLAAGDVEDASRACHELEQIAESFDATVLAAVTGQMRGAVDLAEGDVKAALGGLRRAFEMWQRIGAPYEAARVRVLVATACRALGDEDGAALELAAARAAFERLGAAPDAARAGRLMSDVPPTLAHRLTPRELQVLRLVATGKTNRAIADTLVVSERTVDRHVSNIFTKLDVASRAAATAYAYRHRLV